MIFANRAPREHAAELGNAVPTTPMLFLKPTSSYLRTGGAIEVCPAVHRLGIFNVWCVIRFPPVARRCTTRWSWAS